MDTVRSGAEMRPAAFSEGLLRRCLERSIACQALAGVAPGCVKTANCGPPELRACPLLQVGDLPLDHAFDLFLAVLARRLEKSTIMASSTKVKGRALAIDAACSDFLSSVGLQFHLPQSGTGHIPPSALMGVLLVGYRAFPELERCFGLGQEFYCCNRSGAGQVGSAIGFFYVYGCYESDDAQRYQAL